MRKKLEEFLGTNPTLSKLREMRDSLDVWINELEEEEGEQDYIIAKNRDGA